MRFISAAEWRAGKRERGRRGLALIRDRCNRDLNHMRTEKENYRKDQDGLNGDLHLRHIRFQWLDSVRRHIKLGDYKQAKRVIQMCRDTRIRTGDNRFWQPAGEINTNYLNEDRYQEMLAAGKIFYGVEVRDLSTVDHNTIYREFTRTNPLGGLWGFYEHFKGAVTAQHTLFFEKQGDLIAFKLRFPEWAYLPTETVDNS
jgi:hypothetical protein